MARIQYSHARLLQTCRSPTSAAPCRNDGPRLTAMMLRRRPIDRRVPLELLPEHTMANPGVPSRPPLALIINDQEWWARSLESILAAKGYAVLRAYNGAQALLTARNARPD